MEGFNCIAILTRKDRNPLREAEIMNNDCICRFEGLSYDNTASREPRSSSWSKTFLKTIQDFKFFFSPENRSLKMSFSETQTNIALLRAELNQMRSQYEYKCSELSEWVTECRCSFPELGIIKVRWFAGQLLEFGVMEQIFCLSSKFLLQLSKETALWGEGVRHRGRLHASHSAVLDSSRY